MSKSRIHILKTGQSDCIILESNGLFAMVDSAEDTEYPPDKPNLKLPGYEKEVVEYINKHCADENGNITFEFILGTHAHSDHIGGFDTVILEDNVFIKKAYLKPYHEEGINNFERTKWDNVEVYTQMKNALGLKNIPIIESFDGKEEALGDFRVKFFNGSYVALNKRTGENRNSVVTLVEKDGIRALLAADMNYRCGGEREIADKVGRVDLLKVGHHGLAGSTSAYWVKALKPRYAVICNAAHRVFPDVALKLKTIAKAEVLCTENVNGVIAEFGETLKVKTDIM